MNRKLLRQTANEWRTNLWLALELLIVSIIVWYIADFLYVAVATRLEPTGFDADHVYKLEYRVLPKESPRYMETEGDEKEARADELRRIVNAIRLRPGVEAVSLSMGAEPYSQNYMGTMLRTERDTLDMNVFTRRITPSHIKVLHYAPAEAGVTEDALAEKLSRGEYLVSDFYPGFNSTHGSGPNIKDLTASQLVGRRFHLFRDSVDNFTIGGVVGLVKRTSIESGGPISLFVPINESTTDILSGRTISVRVSPEADRDFIDGFNADRERLYRSGNTYISKIQSYDSVRKAADHDNMVEIRKYIACMVFMLVSVFLGLLGTFWFRTQQRVPEIAVRKVNGASNTSVFSRLIGEGMLLLALVTPVAAIVDCVLCKYEFNSVYGAFGYFSGGRFLITVIFTFVVIALMIIGGIWFPAARAMKIDPARALADE